MIVSLNELKLDIENPRFIEPNESFTSEAKIFEYLKEYEQLDELMSSIKRAGFFQFGERPIAYKKRNEYIVLEGNRRICALKALHGYYSTQTLLDDDKLEATKQIDVDIVDSPEVIQSYLAVRHIQGIQLWKPEAKRNFYSKHFRDGKTISFISNITQRPLSEIKKLIRDSLYLDFFKEKSNLTSIDKPSIIYERIYPYSLNLKLIQKIEVNESIADTKIVINESILTQEELSNFYHQLATLMFESNLDDSKKIKYNSRAFNTFEQFKATLLQDETEQLYPKLVNIFKKALEKIERLNFVPIQIIHDCYIGRVPEIDRIIDYKLISDDISIEIIDDKGDVISTSNFYASPSGVYTIRINDKWDYKFRIDNLKMPEIKYLSQNFKDITVGTTVHLENLIHVFDVYENPVSLNDKNIKFKSLSDKLIINNTTLLAKEADNYSFTITYSYMGKSEYTITKPIDVFVKTITPNGQSQRNYVGYFDFKIIDVTTNIGLLTSGKLLIELEDNYSKKNMHIFISALRSLIELCLENFHVDARRINPSSQWAIAKDESEIKDLFKNLTTKDIKDISRKYNRHVRQNTNEIIDNYVVKNYLESNISHDRIEQVIATLHLGAHKSLKNMFQENVEIIRPTLVAWIELMFIIKETNF